MGSHFFECFGLPRRESLLFLFNSAGAVMRADVITQACDWETFIILDSSFRLILLSIDLGKILAIHTSMFSQGSQTSVPLIHSFCLTLSLCSSLPPSHPPSISQSDSLTLESSVSEGSIWNVIKWIESLQCLNFEQYRHVYEIFRLAKTD